MVCQNTSITAVLTVIHKTVTVLTNIFNVKVEAAYLLPLFVMTKVIVLMEVMKIYVGILLKNTQQNNLGTLISNRYASTQT